MIYGIGTDISKCSRFESWLKDFNKCRRFFNEKEIPSELLSKVVPETGLLDCEQLSENSLMKYQEHFAARFAAKEAFSKALGTGFADFDLKDIFITNNKEGKPIINVENKAKKFLDQRVGKCELHVSLSHEKEFAVAFVIIEK